MQARLDRGAVRLLTRTGLYWTHKYSAIASAVSALRVRKGYFDGELCGVSPDGVTSFSFFGQTSASSRRSPIEILLQRSVDCALTRDRAEPSIIFHRDAGRSGLSVAVIIDPLKLQRAAFSGNCEEHQEWVGSDCGRKIGPEHFHSIIRAQKL